MPKGVKATEKLSEKDMTIDLGDLAVHHDLLKTIVESLEDKVRGLQKQVEQETALLVTTQEQHERLAADFKIEREQAQQRLNAELEGERLALKTRWAEVEQAQKDLGDVQGDLRRLADAQAVFEQQKQALSQLSMATERDRAAATDLMEQAAQRDAQSASRLAEALAKEHAASMQLAEATTLSQQTAQHREQINLAKEAQDATLKRLEVLREEIDPKLAAITAKESAVNEAVVKSEKLHGEAMQRIAEAQQLEADLHGLSARLEAREKTLLDLHIQLRQYSLELTAKAQQLKAQGADVSEPPVVPPVEESVTGS